MRQILCLFLLSSFFASAQKHTISGYVKDRNSGESLIGASVFSLKNQQGTTTNSYGFFSVTQSKDSIHLRASYVGYESITIKFLLRADTTINIELTSGTNLREIEITGTAEDRIQESTQMSAIEIPIEQIKAMPAFLGEVDVFKVLQLLPGVQSGAEGTSGLYVRGGGPDQNLILLDGVPVYNASHLFGFFSVFNADAMNHVELIKGGFPARYGGRLSSVIDINMKEGNTKQIKGEGAIGIVASRFTLEGPIGKKTSFIISGRRTYIDLLARPLIKKASDGESVAGYYFYDLNAKINHTLNSKNKIYLSAYAGDDKFYAQNKFTYNNEFESGTEMDEGGLKWGNITTAFRWNRVINNKLFSNITATYSRYRFSVFSDLQSSHVDKVADKTTREHFNILYTSGIRDFALKADFDFLPTPDHFIKFGIQAIEHFFTPGVLSFSETDQIAITVGNNPLHAKEFFIYGEDDFRVSDKLKINGGLHASGFLVNDKFYYSIQPRISARYLLTPDFSWKGSYARMTQYIHLLSNVGIGLPTDLWVPSTPTVGPEQSFLTATGAAYNLNNKFEISVEGYYKKMEGLIEYKEGASYLNVENSWETKVETGEGESYGAEFFLQKKTGKLTGWIGYTLSWTNRTFKNLNAGKTFPYKYDRRHDFEIATSYQVKPNKEFSMTWVYGTGNAVTLPQSTYPHSQEEGGPYFRGTSSITYYGERNSYRMRAYNRLDLSYTTTKKKKWGERSWVFGIYNVYSRRNPFYMDIVYDKSGNKKFAQYSVFPIIPSISYRFKF
jgi:outer membrane receptor for ferrienterochelin and colicin